MDWFKSDNFWGGAISGSTVTNSGAKYNPSTDQWTTISTTNAPSGRTRHVAGWTGSKMIVIGGTSSAGGSGTSTDGGMYDPSSDTWTSIPSSNYPSTRMNGVWLGDRMLIRGGDGKKTGALFYP